MSRSPSGPEFGSRCVFCGTGLFSVRRGSERADPCAPLLFCCPECGSYLLCREFVFSLEEKPARGAGLRRFVTEAAREGLLPTLCVNRQDFEEIANPFIRAWQKCPGCRSGPPSRTADGRFAHDVSAGEPCRAGAEWREMETRAGGGPRPL